MMLPLLLLSDLFVCILTSDLTLISSLYKWSEAFASEVALTQPLFCHPYKPRGNKKIP